LGTVIIVMISFIVNNLVSRVNSSSQQIHNRLNG
jgi:hypothetical protein